MQQLKSLALEAIKTANTHNFYVSNIVWMHKITCKYVWYIKPDYFDKFLNKMHTSKIAIKCEKYKGQMFQMDT